MTVTTVRPFPAVLIDEAAVDFAVPSADPAADGLIGVVDHEVDELATRAGCYVQAAEWAAEVHGGRARGPCLPLKIGGQQLKIPQPDVLGLALEAELEAAVDGDALSRIGADVDRSLFRTAQIDVPALRTVLAVRVPVRAAANPENVAGRDRVPAFQGGNNIPRRALRTRSGWLAIGGDEMLAGPGHHRHGIGPVPGNICPGMSSNGSRRVPNRQNTQTDYDGTLHGASFLG